jgi:recombination protein RecR
MWSGLLLFTAFADRVSSMYVTAPVFRVSPAINHYDGVKRELTSAHRGARALRARYHVLGGTLSPLDGIGPKELGIERLVARVAEGEVKEVILALNATVDGQTTAHYITDALAPLRVKVTRLAHGVPVGGELDYLTEGTLAAALRARTAM